MTAVSRAYITSSILQVCGAALGCGVFLVARPAFVIKLRRHVHGHGNCDVYWYILAAFLHLRFARMLLVTWRRSCVSIGLFAGHSTPTPLLSLSDLVASCVHSRFFFPQNAGRPHHHSKLSIFHCEREATPSLLVEI